MRRAAADRDSDSGRGQHFDFDDLIRRACKIGAWRRFLFLFLAKFAYTCQSLVPRVIEKFSWGSNGSLPNEEQQAPAGSPHPARRLKVHAI